MNCRLSCRAHAEVAEGSTSPKSEADVIALDSVPSEWASQPKVRITYLVAAHRQLLVFYSIRKRVGRREEILLLSRRRDDLQDFPLASHAGPCLLVRELHLESGNDKMIRILDGDGPLAWKLATARCTGQKNPGCNER